MLCKLRLEDFFYPGALTHGISSHVFELSQKTSTPPHTGQQGFL